MAKLSKKDNDLIQKKLTELQETIKPTVYTKVELMLDIRQVAAEAVKKLTSAGSKEAAEIAVALKALGDYKKDESAITTIHRNGYQDFLEVEEAKHRVEVSKALKKVAEMILPDELPTTTSTTTTTTSSGKKFGEAGARPKPSEAKYKVLAWYFNKGEAGRATKSDFTSDAPANMTLVRQGLIKDGLLKDIDGKSEVITDLGKAHINNNPA